jgi:hypothetical protein
MPCYLVCGRTGQGKGLCSVGMIAEMYIAQGKRVATNMDLFPERFKDPYNDKTRIIRLPDIPTAEDLYALGMGNDEPWDEDANGVLCLDEASIFLNNRAWNDKSRAPLLAYLMQRRKFGWDVILQVQDQNCVDKQAFDGMIDYVVSASYVRNINIPVLSALIKNFLGVRRLMFPKWARWHTARMVNAVSGLTEDVHRYRGHSVYPLYDTTQVFSRDYPHGMHSLLTPWHLRGRYMPPKRDIRYWLRFAARLPLLLIISLCALFSPSVRGWLHNCAAHKSS